jgi:hypothetical protein
MSMNGVRNLGVLPIGRLVAGPPTDHWTTTAGDSTV